MLFMSSPCRGEKYVGLKFCTSQIFKYENVNFQRNDIQTPESTDPGTRLARKTKRNRERSSNPNAPLLSTIGFPFQIMGPVDLGSKCHYSNLQTYVERSWDLNIQTHSN